MLTSTTYIISNPNKNIITKMILKENYILMISYMLLLIEMKIRDLLLI